MASARFKCCSASAYRPSAFSSAARLFRPVACFGVLPALVTERTPAVPAFRQVGVLVAVFLRFRNSRQRRLLCVRVFALLTQHADLLHILFPRSLIRANSGGGKQSEDRNATQHS